MCVITYFDRRGEYIKKIPKEIPSTDRFFKNVNNAYSFEELIELDKNQIDCAEEYFELFLLSLMTYLYKAKHKPPTEKIKIHQPPLVSANSFSSSSSSSSHPPSSATHFPVTYAACNIYKVSLLPLSLFLYYSFVIVIYLFIYMFFFNYYLLD